MDTVDANIHLGFKPDERVYGLKYYTALDDEQTAAIQCKGGLCDKKNS